MKQAPKYFDLNRSLGMLWNDPRVDRLSRTDEEKHERFLTSLHESAHLLVSMRFSLTDRTCGCMGVTIPRVGRSVPGRRGTAGLTKTLEGYPASGEPALNAAMGIAVERLLGGRESSAASDLEALTRKQPNPTTQHKLKLLAAMTLIANLPLLDVVATALLFHSDTSGAVRRHAFGGVCELIRNYPSNHSVAQHGQLQNRTLFPNSFPHAKRQLATKYIVKLGSQLSEYPQITVPLSSMAPISI